MDIIGAATATATNVNVNGQTAYRRGEYYWKELSVNNASAAQWQSVTNRAVQNGTTNTVTGNVFLAKTPEALSYDRDGNLTNDGRWMLTWDAENRLIQIESQSSAPTASKRKVVFTYDYRGRMVRRTEYNGSSGSYVITNDLKLLYDGYHCMAELNATNNALVRSYLWGLDLSGSLGGAGGVGGLLAINSSANGIHFFAYDGNGNVTALVKATDGSVSARYEYDPFGQTIRATGTMAKENPYRFSTKRTDDATDLVHYEFRVYRPCTGTWLSRDPITEDGGPNLYAANGGNPISFVDALGKQFDDHGEITVFSVGLGAKSLTRTQIIDFRARCKCLRGLMCKLEFIAFRMVTRTEIGLYAVISIDAPPPYIPYASAEVTRNRIHEAKHRQRDRMWHDSNIAGIVSDLSQRVACGACEHEIERIKQKWNDEWAKFYASEREHLGPAWTDADRTPTPPELNPDESTWLWEMPVDSLPSPFPIN